VCSAHAVTLLNSLDVENFLSDLLMIPSYPEFRRLHISIKLFVEAEGKIVQMVYVSFNVLADLGR